MFGFFKKTCDGCGVKLPKDFKIINEGYCSKKCESICYDIMELLELKIKMEVKLDGFQQRRLDSLKEALDENLNKMKMEFENK